MRTFAIALLAGAGALSVGSAARASDIYTSSEYTNPDLVQQVRMVCDEDGRCYRTHGGSRVIVRDSYNYAPRERYIERREYRDWDDGPRPVSASARPALAWEWASAIAGKQQWTNKRSRRTSFGGFVICAPIKSSACVGRGRRRETI